MGVLFGDVAEALERWHSLGFKVHKLSPLFSPNFRFLMSLRKVSLSCDETKVTSVFRILDIKELLFGILKCSSLLPCCGKLTQLLILIVSLA